MNPKIKGKGKPTIWLELVVNLHEKQCSGQGITQHNFKFPFLPVDLTLQDILKHTKKIFAQVFFFSVSFHLSFIQPYYSMLQCFQNKIASLCINYIIKSNELYGNTEKYHSQLKITSVNKTSPDLSNDFAFLKKYLNYFLSKLSISNTRCGDVYVYVCLFLYVYVRGGNFSSSMNLCLLNCDLYFTEKVN